MVVLPSSLSVMNFQPFFVKDEHENKQIVYICPYHWGDCNSLYTFKGTCFISSLLHLASHSSLQGVWRFHVHLWLTFSSVRPTKFLEFNISQPLFIIIPINSPQICPLFISSGQHLTHLIKICRFGELSFDPCLSSQSSASPITKFSQVSESWEPPRHISNSLKTARMHILHHFLYLAPSSCILEW